MPLDGGSKIWPISYHYQESSITNGKSATKARVDRWKFQGALVSVAVGGGRSESEPSADIDGGGDWRWEDNSREDYLNWVEERDWDVGE